jgi:hypothetical protein
MKRNIAIAVLIIVAAAGFYAYRMYNKGPVNVSDKKADFIVSAATLLGDFESDENAALAKYLNKIIETEGQLLDIQKVGNQTIWIVSTGSPLSNIQCEMDSRFINEVGDKVKKGMNVKIQGICSGKLMDIVLNQTVYKL